MGTGVTEIIALFAGHFHISAEVGRLRMDYDEFAGRGRHHDGLDQSSHSDHPQPHDLDDFITTRGYFDPSSGPPGFLGYIPDFADPFPPGRAHVLTGEFPDHVPSLTGASPGSPTLIVLAQDAPVITVTYEPGGDQHAIYLQQQNLLLDNDIVAPDGSAAASLQMQDIDGSLNALNEQANAELPSELAISSYDTGSLVTFASQHDTEWAQTGETTRGEVEPGTYINGELQPDGAELPIFPRTFDSGEAAPPDQYPTDVPGQFVTAGSNLVANAAAILDVNHALGTLVVMGDYFRTDAIVQVNLYVDSDKIEYAGNTGFDIEGHGNQAYNIASFLDTDLGIPSFAGSNIFPGLDWHVDVFNGDLYDVQSITQSNWLYDNDVTVQDSYETNYQLLVGANEEGNFGQFLTIGGDYDLVIVLGDYHEINFIYQKNVLLDPDIVKVLGYDALPGGDGLTDPSIVSGDNWLHNEASIEQIGTSSYVPITPDWEALIEQLNNGTAELDPASGLGIPNFNDPTLNILLVTGDIYDINAIAQQNVVADADVVIQALPDAAADSTPVMQVANTGDNALGNFASIVHTGPAADYYIGGDLYEDEMLIQSDIVVADNDNITQNDPNALANELIAFTSPPEDDGGEGESALGPSHDPGHSDLLGHVLV
jgi:hypothetical protein